MNVALGLKSHSGWAAAIIIEMSGGHFNVVDRRRIELVEEGQEWAMQPYHTAEKRSAEEARRLVRNGLDSADRMAARRIKETADRCRDRGQNIIGCGVLIPQPMPDWTIDEILAVHIRMHKAEGVLFPAALCAAAKAQHLKVSKFPEKHIAELATDILGPLCVDEIFQFGRSIGPPWGKDQKLAALAAAMSFKTIKPK